MLITKRVEFSASHVCRNPALSDSENEALFGIAANPHGHGHNYVAEITVRGQPDSRTGIVIDLGQFEALLDDEIDRRFDHKHLNLDTEFFKIHPATAENIAIVIWNLIAAKIPACRTGGKVDRHAKSLLGRDAGARVGPAAAAHGATHRRQHRGT